MKNQRKYIKIKWTWAGHAVWNGRRKQKIRGVGRASWRVLHENWESCSATSTPCVLSLSLSLSALHLTLRKGKRENFVKKLRMCHASTFMTVCDTVLHYGPGKRQLNTLKAPPQLGLGAVTVTVLGNFHFLFFTPYYIT